ncbi:hypothetical protein DBR32_04505 [Taibaiella sp. KBW10]|uniref:hypothetical protein n=1 Tax=Taibaiella sp. KBW10 TaxID=2153357 RepID=UPI000F5A1FA9|nr:hypothetical protein [Taibaiella sp. KBW10]RQO31236.1 hypothetical protein DBR32_04505 [Taibaiella sp. KBW10]
MKYLVSLFSLSALLSVLFFGSCKKKKIIDPTNEGISTYLPTNVNNWWKYLASDGTVFKRYYTGRDTVVDGFNYNLFEQVDVNTGTIVKEFYAKFEGNYYTLLQLDNSGTRYVKAIVLNENPQVGNTWESTGSFTYGIAIPTKIEGKVTSINGTFTVNNVVVDSVVEVKSVLYGKLNLLTWTNCGTIIMKFRRGLGIISENYDFNVGGFFSKQYSNYITDYYVQP